MQIFCREKKLYDNSDDDDEHAIFITIMYEIPNRHVRDNSTLLNFMKKKKKNVVTMKHSKIFMAVLMP